ncbi:hypothetical protein PR202_gb12220 [Eleusine coracana subsp. coracana]|uniref:Uncharacterized protein n=1 Tax=Eleusine coracana subsp. coracana TaxID=191504 RepID=A0AAV5EM90_ELECO|nr:hypothetical protein PR202_gb12220 [Eleusine coracana subsp. coracana]
MASCTASMDSVGDKRRLAFGLGWMRGGFETILAAGLLPTQAVQPIANDTTTNVAHTRLLDLWVARKRRGRSSEQPATSSWSSTPPLPPTFSSTGSSSSSRRRSRQASVPAAPPTTTGPAVARSDAAALLLECGRAMAAGDTERANQLMSMVNELASPHGDVEQKLASYFLQALFALQTGTGPTTLRTLTASAASLDSTRRTTLRFLETSPWAAFGHVAANGAILETFLSEPYQQRFHILDLSNTFCTQWPTFLDALVSRWTSTQEHAPHVTLTTVVTTPPSSALSPTDGGVQQVVREVARKIERYARLMQVPFTFRAVHHAGDLADLDLDALVADLQDGATLAVNCVNALRCVVPAGGGGGRDAFVSSLRRLGPRIVTVVEDDADLVADDFGTFSEALRFFAAYMDSLEASFPEAVSGERLALEKQAGRAIMDVVACSASESAERREPAAAWARRLWGAGFSAATFSHDVVGDMRSLLTHFQQEWSMHDSAGTGVSLAWKQQPVMWASAWRPC